MRGKIKPIFELSKSWDPYVELWSLPGLVNILKMHHQFLYVHLFIVTCLIREHFTVAGPLDRNSCLFKSLHYFQW